MGRVLLLAFGAIYRQNWAWRSEISNKCMKTSHMAWSFRGIWGAKSAKKPPSDEGGGICEANDGGRDWAEGASPRPTWCVISWRLTTSAGAEVGAPGRRAPQKRLPPFRGKLSSKARLMRVPTGVMPLSSAPSSGPSGHLPPCGGKACGASRRPPLRRRKLHIVRFRLAAKARSFRCSSLPPLSLRDISP